MPDTHSTRATAPTGAALSTANHHRAPTDLTLFGSWFCPFVQRVWVAAEFLGVPYTYHEVDPYAKPQDLLAVSPKGLVPALRLDQYTPPRALHESTVILDYLEDLAASSTGSKRSLLPPTTHPYVRALVRLQCDHATRTLAPAFYRLLQAQTPAAQSSASAELTGALHTLIALLERGEREILGGGGGGAAGAGEARALGAGLGLWVEGGELGMVDVVVAPWIYRAGNVLKHYRGFVMPAGEKFEAWVGRLLGHPAFTATCSDEGRYLENYERYAYNRANTSQVANAINAGRELP